MWLVAAKEGKMSSHNGESPINKTAQFNGN